MAISGYQPSYNTGYSSIPSPMYNPYTSDPNYAGDPGTYGSPYGLSPQASQQNFMMSIYISMMQTQTQLQAGFSQYLGMANSTASLSISGGYSAPSYGAPSYSAPSYGATGYSAAPSYSAPSYSPAPAPAPAPKAAPAPAPPAKTGGYA